MELINDIRNEVVTYLLNRYMEAPEDEENQYYFITDPYRTRGDHDYHAQFIKEQLGIFSKEFIRVSFYGDYRNSPICYMLIVNQTSLRINKNEKDYPRVFLVFQVFSDSHDEILDNLSESLVDFSLDLDKNGNIIKIFRETEYPGSDDKNPQCYLIYISEIVISTSLFDKLEYFIDYIKPNIDDCIQPLQKNYKYKGQYLLDKDDFYNYLKKEPIYKTYFYKKNLALKAIFVKEYKGIQSLSITNLPESTRWIILTGENGFGKTSILKAISTGLYGLALDPSPDKSFIKVEYYSNKKSVVLTSGLSNIKSIPKQLRNELIVFGSSRLQLALSNAQSTRIPPTADYLFSAGNLLLNIEEMLKDSYGLDPDKKDFIRIVNLFKTLIPQLANVEVRLEDRIAKVLYFEKDTNGNFINNGLPFEQLASGFKSIIAMIGDLIYRLSTKQKIDEFNQLEGIVIIDELELHLHPTYQKSLPELLTKLFPKIQFIASTHSPIPLLGVPKETVILNVTRSAERGIEVELLDIDFSILTPNAILSSPIFGFKDIIPESKSPDIMIQSEDTYAEVEENKEIRSQISEFLSLEKQKELLNLLSKE